MALPKDPRQLMINLMYLVLTAMLALNITKEVLTAFETINTSIEGSITSISGKNATFYKQINDLYSDSATRVKATDAYTKAALISAESDKLMKYLDNLKDTVISRSGGYELGGHGDSVMKGLDNIDVSTKYFVDDKEGDNLKNRMNAFKKFLVEQVKDTFRNSVGKAIPISLDALNPNDENPTGDWAFGTFHNIPVVATVAMLSKFQSDVKNSESIVLENLLSQIGIDDYKFDALQAIATPTTSYALEGQEIEATIILAAYSKTVNPNMGPGVVVKDGVGTMKFRASGVGQQTKSGNVSIMKGGSLENYSYKFNYMVGTAGASLQLDKMNVMYIGVPNPVTLSASGYNIEDVSLSLPGATMSTSGKGHYVAEVAKEGNIEWSILGKSRTGGATAKIGSGVIRVKAIPDPTARVAGKTGGLVATNVMKAQEGVVAKVDGFDFDAQFKVISFRFVFLPKIGDPVPVVISGSNRFNNECQQALARAKAGDRVLIEDVKAVGPDRRVRSINSLILILN